MKKISKILLVDDDPFTLIMQSKLLSNKGYDVFTCHTAVGIFATVAKYNPDIIIMDHDMPVIPGLEAIKQLKANCHTRSIPIIYFSSVDNLAELAREAGADAYVSKSKETDDIIPVIDKLINCLNS